MITIGGLQQKEACDILGITRNTLYRYRKRKDWPGDDAEWTIIQAYVIARRGTGGRRRKSPAPTMTTAGSGNPLEDDAMAEIRAALDLDEELKRTVIEKNKVQIREYQLKCLEEYRTDLRRKLGKILDRLIDALADLDLTSEQLDRVRGVIRAITREVTNEDPQQELGL